MAEWQCHRISPDNQVRADRNLASRLSLGGKQKCEQPTGLRHRLIRTVGIDARKRRDPGRKPAHWGWNVRGSERCSRRARIDDGSLRFVGAQLVQTLNVFQESGRRRSLVARHGRRTTGIACGKRGIRVEYGCRRRDAIPPAQISDRFGAIGHSSCPAEPRRRRLLRRILGSDAFRRRAPVFNTVALAASGDATAQDTEVRAIVVLDPGNNARLPLRRNWSGIGRGEPLIFG
jgi:hypothetical protein